MRVIDNELQKYIGGEIAIVASRFNKEICDDLLESTLNRLKELSVASDSITVVRVPGAVEIPFAAKNLANTKKYSAIICLGAVIRGETTHYDYVCKQVSDGCQRVSFENNITVIFGILTTENKQQALDRINGKARFSGHDFAEAAIEMIQTTREILTS